MARQVTDDDIGLNVLREAPAEATYTIDIVAIHGIGAHPDDSWCKNVGTPDSPCWVNWLSEGNMLPEAVPHARIMRYGYQSQWLSHGAVQQKVAMLGKRFSSALQRVRKAFPSRPLLIIAHCFGGLLAMKALLDTQENGDGSSNLLRSTLGLVFLGTPFRDSETMSQAELLSLAWRELQLKETPTNVLDGLQPTKSCFQGIVEQFEEVWKGSNIKVACFYELESSSLDLGGNSGTIEFLVDESSGSLESSNTEITILLFRCHSAMSKFGKPTEEDYEVVKEMVQQMATTSKAAISHSDNYRNFRVQGIPCKYQNHKDAESLIKRALSIQTESEVIVHSLAASPLQPSSKTATVSFHPLPKCFGSAFKELEVNLPGNEASNEDDSSGHRLVFDTHFEGFTPLQQTEDENCCADIIAISGLNGHALGSFKARQGSFMWLRDALPRDLRYARILIYGYDSQLIQSSSFQNLTDLGRTLQADLNTIRKLNPSRPIIFIGHSLGGLVIKEAIVKLQESKTETELSILDSSLGFLFFGVPHQGMAIESIVPMVQNNPNRGLLETLNRNSGLLERLDKDFHAAFGTKGPLITSFYETEKSPTAVQKSNNKWELSGLPAVLVETSSAKCGSKNSYPINRDHSEMVKFSNKYDSVYARVQGTISSLLESQHGLPAGGSVTGNKLSIQLLNQSRECLRSLSFPQQDSRYFSIFSAVDTCGWLLSNSQYKKWMSKPRGLFWVKGSPGAGKSVLMKFAATTMARENELVYSFFIHGRGVGLQKTPSGIFRALLHSMLESFPEYLTQLSLRFESQQNLRGSYKEGRWQWEETELQKVISELLIKGTKSRAVTLFVDALDECGATEAKCLLNYFRWIMQEAERESSQVKICFSSRHYPILGLAKVSTILVEDKNGNDIQRVVQNRLQALPERKREQIETEILSKAQGGFQWAVLVTDIMIHENLIGTRAESLLKKLATIPQELDELYNEILSAVSRAEQPLMVKLFKWILFAERPLSTQELRDALVTDKDMIHETVQSLRNHDSWNDDLSEFERYIVHISKGLVEFQIRDVWERYHGMDWNREAQFIHQSAADYLLGRFRGEIERCLEDPSQLRNISGHFEISRSCLKYLALSEVQQGVTLDRGIFLSNFPLVLYATRFVFRHIREVEKEGIAQSDLLQLFQWDQRHKSLGKIASIWTNINSSYTPTGWPYTGAGSLHVLISLGAASASDLVLRQKAEDLHCKDSYGNTAFVFAIKESQQITALALLPEVSDVELSMTDMHGRTPIFWAIENGHEPIVRSMIETGKVDLNFEDEDGQTPLFAAAANGHKSIVQFLMQTKDIDVDASDYSGRTPLSWAAAGGHTNVVEILLDTGNVSIESRDIVGQTPLTYAASGGSEDTVKSLLHTGQVDIEAKNLSKQTPLYWASRNGHYDVVKFLLRTGKVNAGWRDQAGQTPLLLAALNGHETVVRLLLELGNADPNAGDLERHTPLTCAVRNGHEAIVKLLLATRRTYVNPRDDKKLTPLFWAVRSGNETIVKLLLQSGRANPSLGDDEDTPLSWAARNGHETMVKLLLETEKKTHRISTRNGQTPLSWAARIGHARIFKLLINEDKFSINIPDKEGRTPLSWAAENGHGAVCKAVLGANLAACDLNDPAFYALNTGHTGVFEMMLDTGMVDIDSVFRRFRNTLYVLSDRLKVQPLIWAASEGNEGMVKVLLGKGKAYVDQRDSNSRTPLSHAVENARKGVIKLLLERGAKIDLVDETGLTALAWAVRRAHGDIVNLLLESGASVSIGPGDSQTLLGWASARGHACGVEILLKTGNIDIDERDSEGRSALFRSVEAGRESVIKSLLHKHARIDLGDFTGTTPLELAAEMGHYSIFELLLEETKAQYGLLDSTRKALLFKSSAGGQVKMVKLLLRNEKIDINQTNQTRCTPLFIASAFGKSDVVELFLKYDDININSADQCGFTPLSTAVANGRRAVVNLLLSGNGIDVNSKDEYGGTPLSIAAEFGYTNIFRQLLQTEGINIDPSDNFGCTPFSYAVENGHENIVNALIDSSGIWSMATESSQTSVVNLDSRDYKGRTPLAKAAEHGHTAVFRRLIRTGKVDINTRDKYGWTPLLAASANGHRAIVRMLLRTGKVDVFGKDQNGHTSLWWAQHNSDDDMVNLLLQPHFYTGDYKAFSDTDDAEDLISPYIKEEKPEK